MHNYRQIAEKVYWVGANDRKTHLFENYWPLPKGVAYNSYVVVDEKVAIIDTVEKNSMDDYVASIEAILDGREADYLIVNHMEPDHSGSIKALVEKYPNMKIVGNIKTFPMLKRFYQIHDNLLEVKEGDQINLGDNKLNFYMVPMLHWPETMVTYESTKGILFSADAFGSFGTLDGGIFDDEVDLEYLEDEISRYYSNIVGKYGSPTQKALAKLGGLELNMICATHGPIWRTNIADIIAKYDKWSKYETDKGCVIVYSSMYGNTEKMADNIAHELMKNGVKKIRIHDASKTHPSYIINDIFKFKAVVLGSCAYNGGIFPTMETLINEIEHMGIKNHVLGIFGSKSWGGGGLRRLQEFSKKIKWDLVETEPEALCSPDEKDYCLCANLAKGIAEKLN
ncbi:MAG: FprA family A-type flavoprotein [Marinifilaceae bacterium]|jgi:flavorubredoxin|nr:FprA family A-type flavoprotein [Marinifilaceae bacterium]